MVRAWPEGIRHGTPAPDSTSLGVWFAGIEFLAWPDFGLPGGLVWVQ